jgi:hypothetical protein
LFFGSQALWFADTNPQPEAIFRFRDDEMKRGKAKGAAE